MIDQPGEHHNQEQVQAALHRAEHGYYTGPDAAGLLAMNDNTILSAHCRRLEQRVAYCEPLIPVLEGREAKLAKQLLFTEGKRESAEAALAAAQKRIGELEAWPDDVRTCGELSCDECNDRYFATRDQLADARRQLEEMGAKLEKGDDLVRAAMAVTPLLAKLRNGWAEQYDAHSKSKALTEAVCEWNIMVHHAAPTKPETRDDEKHVWFAQHPKHGLYWLRHEPLRTGKLGEHEVLYTTSWQDARRFASRAECEAWISANPVPAWIPSAHSIDMGQAALAPVVERGANTDVRGAEPVDHKGQPMTYWGGAAQPEQKEGG